MSNRKGIPNSVLQDERLSLRAKGLYAFMAANPTLTLADIRLLGPDGEFALRSAARELKALDLLALAPPGREKDGTLIASRYVLKE